MKTNIAIRHAMRKLTAVIFILAALAAPGESQEKPSPKLAKVNYFFHVNVGNALNVYDPTTGDNVACDADTNTKEVSCGKHLYTRIEVTIPERRYPIADGVTPCFIDKPLSRREALKRAEQNECGGALENFALHHTPKRIPDPKIVAWEAKHGIKETPLPTACGEKLGAPVATCGKRVDADNTEFLLPYTLRTLRDKSVWVVLEVDDGEWGKHELWYPL